MPKSSSHFKHAITILSIVSCSIRIIRIIRWGKNSRILTNFIMAMNVRKNYDFKCRCCKHSYVMLCGIQTTQSQQMEFWPPVSGVGTVVSGEASESDGDDETAHFPLDLVPSLHGMHCFYIQYF